MAVVPIDPAKLIEAARDFATHQGAAPGRPRPVWLRRAVSSAYYALFHSIGRQASEHLFPVGTSQEQLSLARSFHHRALKDVCEWCAGRSTKNIPGRSKSVVMSLRGTDIDGVANAFIDLQEARHRADYDHLAPISKAAALASVQDAEAAIQRLAGTDERHRQAFFALLALRTGLR